MWLTHARRDVFLKTGHCEASLKRGKSGNGCIEAHHMRTCPLLPSWHTMMLTNTHTHALVSSDSTNQSKPSPTPNNKYNGKKIEHKLLRNLAVCPITLLKDNHSILTLTLPPLIQVRCIVSKAMMLIGPKSQINSPHVTEGAPSGYWVQLATEKVFFYCHSCDMVLWKILHPAFSSSETVLNRTSPLC